MLGTCYLTFVATRLTRQRGHHTSRLRHHGTQLRGITG